MLKRNSSDSVSALFTQLKNGILAKRKTICVPQTNLNWTFGQQTASKFRRNLLHCSLKEGMLQPTPILLNTKCRTNCL